MGLLVNVPNIPWNGILYIQMEWLSTSVPGQRYNHTDAGLNKLTRLYQFCIKSAGSIPEKEVSWFNNESNWIEENKPVLCTGFDKKDGPKKEKI